MSIKIKSTTLSTGLAMFSMFFGAGNVVFPLGVGQYAQDMNHFAVIGLLITAVGIPFLGLISMTLYRGEYMPFFQRIGKIPGFLTALFIMTLIGPFGGLPRTITVAFSTSKQLLPMLSLPIFSLIACVTIFLLTFKRGRILEILGYVLTPILLASLSLILIVSLFTPSQIVPAEDSPFSIFSYSLIEGYKTMDLLAAFFFSGMVILCLKEEEEHQSIKHLVLMTLKASCIGAGLLGVVYIGFSYISAMHSQALESVPNHEMIGFLAHLLLGNFGGPIASLAVSLACLTTAMALTVVFAEFLYEDILNEKISYVICLLLTLIVAFLMSTLSFNGLDAFLTPILFVVYPSLIVLSLMNLLYKLYDVKWVKIPVYVTLLITVILYLN
ncbi:MAG: branched-chain amino acid transport system II carrier protein [Waddliaceae bacterium]